jgi:hypothetical protein
LHEFDVEYSVEKTIACFKLNALLLCVVMGYGGDMVCNSQVQLQMEKAQFA